MSYLQYLLQFCAFYHAASIVKKSNTMTETAATNAIQLPLPERLASSAFSRRMRRAVPLEVLLGLHSRNETKRTVTRATVVWRRAFKESTRKHVCWLSAARRTQRPLPGFSPRAWSHDLGRGHHTGSRRRPFPVPFRSPVGAGGLRPLAEVERL